MKKNLNWADVSPESPVNALPRGVVLAGAYRTRHRAITQTGVPGDGLQEISRPAIAVVARAAEFWRFSS